MTEEVIQLVDASDSPSVIQTSWFRDYLSRLSRSSNSSKVALAVGSRAVLKYINKGLSDSQGEPVTGLVVGAVQSGKTASMVAVSCLALDEGFNIVVIVSGTRTSLWRQTLNRALRVS